ncbi:hypothetical protein ACOTVM_00760 [Aliarcobacter butzleri]
MNLILFGILLVLSSPIIFYSMYELYIILFKPSHIYVTTWSPKNKESNFDGERWVMLGKGSFFSYLSSGLIGPRYEKNKGIIFSNYPFHNKCTKLVERDKIKYPLGFFDGKLKLIFGQRKYIP